MNHVFSASRISAEQAASRIESVLRFERDLSETISEAKNLIEKAKEEARRAQDLVDATNEVRDTALKEGVQEELTKFLDRRRVEAAAKAAAKMICDAGKVRAEFDALIPWLTEFLAGAISRLIGELDRPELLSRLVAEGVASMKEARGVIVLAHPSDIDHLRIAQASNPLRFAGVADIQADPRMAQDCIFLEGPGGVLDASLETQVSALLDALGSEE